MATANDEIEHEFHFFRVYKNGRLEFFSPPEEKIPPFDDPVSGVSSKDVVVSSNPPVSVRLFLPKTAAAPGCPKLPLLFYMHGGGFCMQSAFSRKHHDFVSAVVAEAGCVAVSVEYGLFPDRPLPGCYEDSWAALEWVAARKDQWIAQHADLDRVFIAGNSAGGTIAHNLASRVGSIGLPGIKVVGVILVHPYFGDTNGAEMWLYMCPTNSGPDDPRLKPSVEDLARLGCERVLVFVAEKDVLMEAGVEYVEKLKKSGWGGRVELEMSVGEHHCFYLSDPTSDKALEFKEKFVSFVRG